VSHGVPQTLDLPDGDVVFFPAFFPAGEADRLLAELLATTAWRQESITLYGKPVAIPRLTAWYGDAGTGYTYSGIVNDPLPWTPALLEVKRAVEGPAGVAFNGVLLNRYRTGRDSVAWHSDDEPEFGENPVIASVSFGSTRTFQFRHKKRKALRASVELTHGSLLVMRGATQHNWVHQIPKTAQDVAERVNLTFRVVRAVGG
jgi:alkylated DNA repair dioxygenase AlkB